jgi:multisubunit Na+/H+ antiporter MnhF subunit
VNVWLIGATVLLAALVPCGFVLLRAELESALAALQLAGTVTTLALVLLAEGYSRSSYYTVPVVLAFLSLVGGLVFVRFFGDRL